MKTLSAILAGMFLAGCGPPPPVPKATHVKQIQLKVAKAGGVTNIASESRTLFTRLNQKNDTAPFYTAGDECLRGLSSLTNLGDVFYFEPPDHVRIRIYNSHFDTYFIALLNPDLPEPAGFERVAGNVGFIEPHGPANRSQPVSPQTNRTSAAAGSGG
jgi:hypothetical protein